MNNTLHWKVPSRAQSAASASSTWTKSSATPSPGAETAEPLYGVEFSPQTNEGYVVNTYVQSPDTSTSVSALCSRPSSGPPRQMKRYWELGGLGPTSIATPEWQVHKERLMAMKAFGKAANEANRLARLRALGKKQHAEAEKEVKEAEAVVIDANDAEEKDESITLLEERAKKRDIALALKL